MSRPCVPPLPINIHQHHIGQRSKRSEGRLVLFLSQPLSHSELTPIDQEKPLPLHIIACIIVDSLPFIVAHAPDLLVCWCILHHFLWTRRPIALTLSAPRAHERNRYQPKETNVPSRDMPTYRLAHPTRTRTIHSCSQYYFRSFQTTGDFQ